MTIDAAINSATEFAFAQPLLALALAGVFLGVLGSILRLASPLLGSFVRGLGNIGLVAALLLTIAQVARQGGDFDLSFPQLGIERQTVEGEETRVEMAPDGHFWVTAQVNGVSQDFLVDTGATLTAIAPSTAQASGVEPPKLRRQIAMRTANGTVPAEVMSIDALQFGNIVARDLDTVVAPGLGDQNVLGMNFLSRLEGWRVEGQTLILVPHHPQPERET